MMEICIFNGDMSRGGGTEHMAQTLANILSEKEDCHVWVLNKENFSGKSYYPLDERVNFAVLPSGSVLKTILALWQFVRKNRIDILINVDIMLGIFSLPVRLLYPRLKIVAWEMFNIRNDIGSRHTKLVRQLSLMFGSYYITLTKGDMDAFKKEMRGLCPITYIYDPCTEDKTYQGYNCNSKTIMTAGHFFYTKGYDLAVEVARIVFRRHPDWKWELYGDGDRMEETMAMVKAYGLGKNVIFCGRTNQLLNAYRNAAIYVMTSRTEGFGLVLTEAKANNLPIVSFDIDFGPREIIEDGKSGFLIKAFDAEEMADRICELIENDAMRCSFSKHAKDNLEIFSIESFAQRWETVLYSIGKGYRKRSRNQIDEIL